ncbi:MAG: TonB-dependent receptor [Deltaproteobacteria bacterium]|nr:TonB-dependent receptor [Deltaproteobacteria bacterium]
MVGPGMTSTEAEAIAESFDNRWSTRKRTIRPNLSLGATVGDTVRVKGKRLGYLATGGYRRGYQTREALVAKVRNIDGDIGYREEMDSVMSQSSTRVGGLFNVGLEAAKGHEIGAFALYTHTGDDTATTVRGFNETDGQDIEASRLRFVERSLAFAQIYGNHAFGRRAQLRWQGNLGHTGRSEPDTRDITYNLIAGSGQARFKSEPGSGERLFAELGEMTLGTGSTLKLESEMADLTLGAIVQGSSRTFDARRFRYVYVGSDPGVLFLPPEQMFSDTNLGPDFELRERTLPTDRYGGSLLVAAGFARSEMRMSDRLRFIVGGRFEASRQNLDSLSPFAAGDAMRVEVEQNDDNFLTALSSVYALSKAQNLRLAYGSTLARPQFRELAPFLFFDTTRRRSVSGNPDLVNTRIHNVDLRWEWFPGVSEVVSAGLFGKYFVDPIEQVIVSASGGDVSYDNASSATALGAELEGRVDLKRLWAPLTGLRLGANAAIVRSRISLTDEQLMSQTSKERPMQGQSPFAINLNLGYQRGAHQAMALYNVSGRRIVEVGFDSLPDVYEQPRHTVDLTYGYQLKSNLRLKASAQNLLAQKLTLQQGELAIYQFQPGVSVGLGLEWIP